MTKIKSLKPPGRVGLRCAFVAALLLALPSVARAQLNEHCTVSVLNRTVRVNPDGTWVLPNIPANFGQVEVRATCVRDGVTTSFLTLIRPTDRSLHRGRRRRPDQLRRAGF